VVWVGFDDNRELNLEGAHSAAPIWAEFMKRALAFRAYRDAKPFPAPDGVVSVEIDPQSGMPATPFCPIRKTEVFIAGTQPVGTCPLHGGSSPGATHVAGWELPAAPPVSPATGTQMASADPRLRRAPQASPAPPSDPAGNHDQDQKAQKRKGFFHRLMDVFK
jgi:penicillin-binding protein 1B